MSTLEERVAHLEGRMEDQATLGAHLRQDVRDLRTEMTTQIADVRADMARQFADTARQFAELRADMARQFADLRAEMRSDRHWIVGLLITSVIAIGSAVIGLYFR